MSVHLFVLLQVISIKYTPFYCLILKSRELKRHYALFQTNPKSCKFYLIPDMMTSAAWKQSFSRFSEQLDFFQRKNSIKFVLLTFYLLCFVSVAFSHSPYILAHDFFHRDISTFPLFNSQLEAAIRLQFINTPKIMVWRSFPANQSSDILQRFRGAQVSQSKLIEF